MMTHSFTLINKEATMSMEAIVALGGALRETVELANNKAWAGAFPEHIKQTYKLAILSFRRPQDQAQVDCFGIIRREALAPFGMDKDFGNRKSGDVTVPGMYLIMNLERAAIVLHEKDPNLLLMGGQREVDLVDFQKLGQPLANPADAMTKTIADMRDIQKFGDMIVGFLTDGRKPLIIAGV
jgi:hypothetical protein